MNNKNIFIIFLALTVIFLISCSKSFAQEGLTISGQPCIVSASSSFENEEGHSSGAGLAFDGNPDKPWIAAGDFNPQAGEWIKLSFTKPANLAALKITPGYGHNQEKFLDNPRIRVFDLEIDNNGTIETRRYTNLSAGSPDKDLLILIPDSQKVKSVTLKIRDIYPGRSAKKVVVGEIEPVFIRDGRAFSPSDEACSCIDFINSISSASSSYMLLPDKGNIELEKTTLSTNPLYLDPKTKQGGKFPKSSIIKEPSLWNLIRANISSDCKTNAPQVVNYIRTDKAKKTCTISFAPNTGLDIMNSYTVTLTRVKADTPKVIIKSESKKPEKSEKKDKKKTATKEKIINLPNYRVIVTGIKMISNEYSP